ncbi:MAG TPA: hypothetical protein DD670_03475 [Planctomycetaceae bacterium]|nr:hypothetical protein [Planctomycetaceae bacterium]
MSSSSRSIWFGGCAELVVGAIIAVVLSILPFELFLLMVSALLITAIVLAYRHVGKRGVTFIMALCVVLAVCALLPVKELDKKVGPIEYRNMTLFEVCEQLRIDHGIICLVLDSPAKECRISFLTDRPLSRRQVLQKLSKDTNRPLHIGYCGTGATLLFGGHPSFTYLEEKKGIVPRSLGEAKGTSKAPVKAGKE